MLWPAPGIWAIWSCGICCCINDRAAVKVSGDQERRTGDAWQKFRPGDALGGVELCGAQVEPKLCISPRLQLSLRPSRRCAHLGDQLVTGLGLKAREPRQEWVLLALLPAREIRSLQRSRIFQNDCSGHIWVQAGEGKCGTAAHRVADKSWSHEAKAGDHALQVARH